MKLLINNDLEAIIPGITAAEVEGHFSFARDMAVAFTVTDSEAGAHIKVPVQTVAADEIDMNRLFFDFLVHFEYCIHYSALGGAGCDMAISLRSPVTSKVR